nr:MAG TPA: hypothetical protein [Caudoviricetes sp.]
MGTTALCAAWHRCKQCINGGAEFVKIHVIGFLICHSSVSSLLSLKANGGKCAGDYVNSLSGVCLSHLFLVSIEYYKFTYMSRRYIQQKIGDCVVQNI